SQAEPAERPALLRELVLEDLDYRLKAGEAPRVEMYLDRYPELRPDLEAVAGLVAAEFTLRRQQEPGLGPEEFLQRFPQFQQQLLQCLTDSETVRPVTVPD